MFKKRKVRAHTNIALIKYWGKADEEYIIPLNSSLSLTLSDLYAETSVIFDNDLDQDIFYLDGEKQEGSSLEKVQHVLDLVRQQARIEAKAYVDSQNFVPTAAGLASSASGMAALAASASLAAGLDLDKKDLSRLARRGSGSASRSIYGGLVQWKKGSNDADSYALPIDPADWGLGMYFILINKEQKKVSSRSGMKQTVETSPYIEQWAKTTDKDVEKMKEAIAQRDFTQIGLLMERSASKMHATTLGAIEPFTYLLPESLHAIQFVQALREKGFDCYFTMDAGPNVKVLIKEEQKEAIGQLLQEEFGPDKILYSGVGPDIQDVTSELD